jgi:hypothetical protein
VPISSYCTVATWTKNIFRCIDSTYSNARFYNAYYYNTSALPQVFPIQTNYPVTRLLCYPY